MIKQKHAFTLIELLVVITIIAILAGAAIPYVKQYVDDSRYSKARQDLGEIRNALIRYETDNGKSYTDSTINPLVGPYLMKAIIDPWGGQYKVNNASSTCYTLGSDGVDGSGDEIVVEFRPPLAMSKVYWEDSNKDGVVSTGDNLILKFTRPLRKNSGDGPVLTVSTDDLVYTSGNPANDYTARVFSSNDMQVKLELDFGANPAFKPGQDSLKVKAASAIVDGGGTVCKSGQPVLIKAR